MSNVPRLRDWATRNWRSVGENRASHSLNASAISRQSRIISATTAFLVGSPLLSVTHDLCRDSFPLPSFSTLLKIHPKCLVFPEEFTYPLL
jgi:hypothetical protein